MKYILQCFLLLAMRHTYMYDQEGTLRRDVIQKKTDAHYRAVCIS